MSTVVIVGGVAGGATAAARLRRLDEFAEIIIIERGQHVSFANCGLPYHIGGVIKQRDALLLATPESLRSTYNIDVRVQQEAQAIDPEAHTLTVRNLVTGEAYELHYDKLILSPGAAPIVPPLPGVDLDGVFTLRNIADMDQILARLDTQPRDALVVGGGFIGLEMAENLTARGLNVALVEMVPQVMAPIDPDMAALVHRELRRNNIRLALGDGLQSIERAPDGRLTVRLASGRAAEADLVMLAIGVRPETQLAKAAGLELGPRGHIVVDPYMQTSQPDILAVGDAIQVTDPVLNRLTAVPLAGPANWQARIAADTIVGRKVAYRGTFGAAIVKVYDLTIGCVGANSRTLDQAGIAYRTSVTHSYDHAGYYPGATQQTIKLLYATEDGRLLGAQAVGMHAIDRTIDVLATALSQRATVYDLEHLELAYAPPFGAAKDPVNIAGYIAAGALRGDTTPVSCQEVAALDPTQATLIDVRTDLEWGLGHMEGALHIPQAQLRSRLGELDRGQRYITYCTVGQRSYVSERVLKQHGLDAGSLSGGYAHYEVATEQQDNWDSWRPPESKLNATPASQSNPVAAAPVAAQSVIELDACGLQCPGPIMAVYRRMQELEPGQVLQARATDQGFVRDVATWAESTGNRLLDLTQDKGVITATLVKGEALPELQASPSGALPRGKTLIVFSGDLDHAMAAMIIANGAAAMGQPVSVFFTFWGLNLLRRPDGPTPAKTFIERMFGWMMPRGARRVRLSNLNMLGLGTAMMKGVMRSKNIDTLESLIASAQQVGVRLIACQMTMDMMGIKPEELIDGVEIGGVATMLGETDKGNGTWFI
ncbi:MAG: FAD-dependent oxidoreductase [Anaerolineae bacterium]|jgi:NADPH-dependent 2,4-dienoyl-CoA reductase/sulfur reductase-like enzyme/peroxiredoxin family protein/rhodanese-related sulfurtransferase/TusA-related sulfurtransferase